MKGLSPKVGAAAVGAAVGTIIWTLVAELSPGTFSDTAITSLTGSTGTILAFALGFVIRDSRSAL